MELENSIPPQICGCQAEFRAPNKCSLRSLWEGKGHDRTALFRENEADKLLKTKDRPFKMEQNEPEYSLKFNNVSKTNRIRKLAILFIKKNEI
jgi:hypothetical protein